MKTSFFPLLVCLGKSSIKEVLLEKNVSTDLINVLWETRFKPESPFKQWDKCWHPAPKNTDRFWGATGIQTAVNPLHSKINISFFCKIEVKKFKICRFPIEWQVDACSLSPEKYCIFFVGKNYYVKPFVLTNSKWPDILFSFFGVWVLGGDGGKSHPASSFIHTHQLLKIWLDESQILEISDRLKRR